MCVQKLAYTNSDADNVYLSLSVSEIVFIHNKIVNAWNTYLKPYDVKPLWSELKPKKDENGNDIPYTDEEIVKSLDAKELQLIFLYKYKGKLVHKDLISAFVRKYKPNAGLDQQIRHLGSQYNWNVLNKGNKIPDEDVLVPSGYHYLVSIETPNPKVVVAALKRAGRLAAKTFDDLVIAYNNKCATCGIEQGKKDPRMNVIVKLQQGHMNPRKDLTLDNTIPQCQYCNQTYQDYFQFNEWGRVIAVNNPEILLKSPVDVQDEMIAVLLRERQMKSETLNNEDGD